MKKVIAYEFLSLDGFMAGKEGREMDFVTENFLPEIEADIAGEYDRAGAFLMGRTTYEILSQYWPDVTVREEPLADYMNKMEKIVFSSSLSKAEKWQNSSIVCGELRSEIEALKKRKSKNMIIIGSASMVQQLTDEKLIDEYYFLLFPVVLGEGKPLFDKISNKI